MVYRYKNQWQYIATDRKTLKKRQLLYIKDPAITEECSYLLNDDGEIDCNLLVEHDGTWFPNMDKIREAVDGYVEKSWMPIKEANSIFNRYDSMVFVDFQLKKKNIEKWLQAKA